MRDGLIQELVNTHNVMLITAHRIVRARYHRLHRQIIIDVFMMALIAEGHRVGTAVEGNLLVVLRAVDLLRVVRR